MAEYVLTFTEREAEFMYRLGRHLRKQEGWWDDREWEDVASDLWTRLEKRDWYDGLAGVLAADPSFTEINPRRVYIGHACDQFETTWNAGRGVRVFAYLPPVPSPTVEKGATPE